MLIGVKSYVNFIYLEPNEVKESMSFLPWRTGEFGWQASLVA